MRAADSEWALAMGTGLFQFNIPSHETAQTTWTFNKSTVPNMGLNFLPRPPCVESKKRSRVAADIDGEHSCMQKKKRRLRLFLITSRLSPQFSHPATNIVDRGSSKIAVWAKQKALGRNLLRKAAILNCIGRQAISAREAKAGHGHVLVEQEREQEELQLARLEFNGSSVDTYTRPVLQQTPAVSATAATEGGHLLGLGSPSTSKSPSPTLPSPPQSGEAASEYRSPNEAYAYSPPRAQGPRRDYLPLPPSPLGISNYDAFDVDDDIPDPYSRFDDEDEVIFNPYDDNDVNDSPFSPCITTTSSSSVPRGTTQVLRAPPQPLYSDFSVLDPEQAVFGDYDQVDDGADAIWPSSYAHHATASAVGSTSPDFPALFATVSPKSKRTDSFIDPPDFRPTISNTSISPNFPSCTTPPTTSPNIVLLPSPALSAESPKTTLPITPALVSPNFQAAFTSPNFAAADALPTPNKMIYSSTARHTDDPRTLVLARRGSDMEQERQRQRSLIFMRFGS